LDLEAGCQPISPARSKSPQEKTVNFSGNLPAYSNNHHEGSPDPTLKPAINAAMVHIGKVSCTMGGVLIVNGELHALTVAHAFEDDMETIARTQGTNFSANSIPTTRKRVDLDNSRANRIFSAADPLSNIRCNWNSAR
jgi:hypothetical protein